MKYVCFVFLYKIIYFVSEGKKTLRTIKIYIYVLRRKFFE